MRYTRTPLTIGDGFRVGFGIAFWLVVLSTLVWFAVATLGLLVMSAGGGS